jgi:hypothetical protein
MTFTALYCKVGVGVMRPATIDMLLQRPLADKHPLPCMIPSPSSVLLMQRSPIGIKVPSKPPYLTHPVETHLTELVSAT